MTRDRLPPRRESLRDGDGSPARVAVAAGGVSAKGGSRARRMRAPRTYARKRAREEAAQRAAQRSAEHSLDTRNCGEGRLSLAPLPAPESPVASPPSSDSDSDDAESGTRRRGGARKRAAKTVGRKGTKRSPLADRDGNEDKKALDRFMAQQKAFWKEVDDLELLEEDVG